MTDEIDQSLEEAGLKYGKIQLTEEQIEVLKEPNRECERMVNNYVFAYMLCEEKKKKLWTLLHQMYPETKGCDAKLNIKGGTITYYKLAKEL